MIGNPTYREAIENARERCEPHDENRGSEYTRGMINLIADLWGIPGMDTGTRMDQVERDIFGPPYPEDNVLTESDIADAREDLAREMRAANQNIMAILSENRDREDIRALFERTNNLTHLCHRLQVEMRDMRVNLERQLDILAHAIPDRED